MDNEKRSVEEALQRYFQWKQRKKIHRGLLQGLLAPYWDDLAASLLERRYTWYTVRRTIEIAKPFAVYAEGRGVRDATGFGDELVADYLREHPLREGPRSLGFLMSFLRERGIVAEVSSPKKRRRALVEQYESFLRDQRGLTAGRVQAHTAHVQAFLQTLGKNGSPSRIRHLNGARVSEFITDYAESRTRSQRKSMCTALRSFLRFLKIRGHLRSDLALCVPVIPSFKLDRVPAVIGREDIEKILAAVDRSTPQGRRDYAILITLASYGIRTRQLCSIRLDDIDWRHETLRVRGVKAGRDVMLPLLPSVGEAIVDYLRNGRPDWPLREVFLRIRAPMGPLRFIVGLIRPYAEAAGVERWNPHAWRHACATRMLESGQPLKTIRDVLGHRSIETTTIYTKVDIKMLRQAALEWPEVTP